VGHHPSGGPRHRGLQVGTRGAVDARVEAGGEGGGAGAAVR
jgi:hypothetical protein